jgi:hypothetical protein
MYIVFCFRALYLPFCLPFLPTLFFSLSTSSSRCYLSRTLSFLLVFLSLTVFSSSCLHLSQMHTLTLPHVGLPLHILYSSRAASSSFLKFFSCTFSSFLLLFPAVSIYCIFMGFFFLSRPSEAILQYCAISGGNQRKGFYLE